jgi:hypothetical protein
MIKIDENLPWIELDRTFQTKGEAREAATQALRGMKTRVVGIPDKKRPTRAIATIRMRR